jgi:hypothetical protein
MVLFSMNRPAIEKMKEIGNQIRLDIYRIPKKNHPSMVQWCRTTRRNLLMPLERMEATIKVSSSVVPKPLRALLV